MRILLALFFIACTDTTYASLKAYGDPATIICYSGGQKIFEGRSTGKLHTVDGSDGWEFMDAATGKFIRVSGDCVIVN